MRVGLGATAVGLFLLVLLLPLFASRGAVQARGAGEGDEAVYLPLIMHLLSPRNIATPTATTTFAAVRVSVVSDGTQGNATSSYPSISADSRYVAFVSLASNLVANDTNGVWDVFLYDRGQ